MLPYCQITSVKALTVQNFKYKTLTLLRIILGGYYGTCDFYLLCRCDDTDCGSGAISGPFTGAVSRLTGWAT